MRTFDEISKAAKTVKEIVQEPKVRWLFYLLSAARRSGTRSDDQVASSKQLGLVAALAELKDDARHEWLDDRAGVFFGGSGRRPFTRTTSCTYQTLPWNDLREPIRLAA